MSEVEWINESIDLNEILMDIDEFVRYPENNKKKKKLRKKISELKQLDYDNEEIRLAIRIAKNLLRKNEVTKKENDESKERMIKMSVDPSSPEINASVEEAIKNIDKNIDKVMGDASRKSDEQILESIGEKVNKVTELVRNNLNKQRDLETTIKRLRDENKELRNKLECKHESSRILDPTIDIEISMKVNILKSDFDEYKKLEHHIERFVDMDSWKPNEVYDVKVNEVFKNKEDV